MSTNILKSCFCGIASRRKKNSKKTSQSSPGLGQGSSTPAQNAAISPSVYLSPDNQATTILQRPVTPNNTSSTSLKSHPAQALAPALRPSPAIHPTQNSVLVAPALTLHPSPINQAASIHRPVTPLLASVTPDPALKVAIEKYVAELSDHDKAAFVSPGEIIDKMREIDKADSRSNLCRSFGDRIGKILHCINGFVDSVAICIQHSPDISSLVVGGLHCVLRLVLNYIEFFESLTQMMERIGGHLQYLSKYSSPVFQNLPDLQNALVKAYCDLLDFFVAVRGVFTDKEGRASYLKSFKLFMRVTWEPFESKFKPIEEKFLNHTLVVVRSAGVENLIMERENLGQKIQEEKVEKRRKVLEWLSPIDYEETHQRHYKKHFNNTGQWLLDHPDFADWEGSLESSLLWCYGNPGAGKTVLASLVVERLSARYELSNDTGITFLYCNYKESHEAATYVRTIIQQLSRRMSELPAELETLYDRHYSNASRPGYTELQNVFIEISKHFKKVFFILDALDECTDNQRQELFDVLRSIITPSTSDYGKVKLFITSRETPDIRRAFSKFPVIRIEAKKVDVDIETYVTAQLNQYLQDKTLILRDTTLKDEIITTLVGRAGGMFLWIEFQLKHICSQISDYDIRQALGNLPTDMEKTYERIIDSINKPGPHRELARRTLMWIAYAERPLLVQELVEAVAMEKDTKSYEILKSKMPPIETVLDVCKNLVGLDDAIIQSKRIVRFVHFSVQEFLLKNSPDNYPAMSFLGIEPEFAHTEIAQLCITFVVFCQYEIDTHNGRRIYAYTSLFAYAESTWYTHIRALSEISNVLMTIILEFFRFGIFLEGDTAIVYEDRSIRCYSHGKHTKFSPPIVALIFDLPLVSEYLDKHYNEQQYPEDLYAMHYAARQNSPKAVERLYNQGFRVDELDTHGCTPLYYAAGKEVCQLLLDRGADVNAQGGEYGIALQAAVYIGSREVVQLLLDKGADVNAQGGHYGSALQAALCRGNREVVQLLLDRGADVHAQGGHYRSALQAAAYDGSRDVVQLLLDRGADVHAQGGEYGSALQAAVCTGSKEVTQLLLNRGVDVNVQGGEYGSALQAAAYTGSRYVVQLLLDRGVDVNAQGGHYGSALQAAVCTGSKEVVQMLLDKGADVNVQGGHYGSALQAAAAYTGSRDVVQLLLDRGADVNVQGGEYGSALQAAVCTGSREMVQLLLDRGADVNVQGGQYGSALQAAVYGGNRVVVQLLLDAGADVHAQGGEYGSALQAAAYDGSRDLVQLLLDRGADVHAQGGRYGSALQAAAYDDSRDVVQLLLDKGADVNVQGGRFGSALQAAAFSGSRDVVQLLLDRGADVHAQGGEYGSALQAAVWIGGRDVVQLLLDRGADVHAQGGRFGSALQAAADDDSRDVVQLLLDKGADVNVQGGEYGSALQAAAYKGSRDVVQLLLDRGADVNAQGGHYGNALQAAVKKGNKGVEQLLLRNGAIP